MNSLKGWSWDPKWDKGRICLRRLRNIKKMIIHSLRQLILSLVNGLTHKEVVIK